MVRSLPMMLASLLAVASVPSPTPGAQEFTCARFEPPVSPTGVAGKMTGADFRALSSRDAIHALARAICCLTKRGSNGRAVQA